MGKSGDMVNETDESTPCWSSPQTCFSDCWEVLLIEFVVICVPLIIVIGAQYYRLHRLKFEISKRSFDDSQTHSAKQRPRTHNNNQKSSANQRPCTYNKRTDNNTIPVQLYFRDLKDWRKEFETALREKGLAVQLVSLKDLHFDKPVLVACPAESRAEHDLYYALDELRESHATFDPNLIILVRIHLKVDGKQPTRSTMETLHSNGCDNYDKFRLIIDVAYTHEDKLYDCNFNKTFCDVIKNVPGMIKIEPTDLKRGEKKKTCAIL